VSDRVKEALQILIAMGMPRAQHNDRSALCLLALAEITPDKEWALADAPLIGITPIMRFAADHYMEEPYAPNTREMVRRQSMHQFCEAGIAIYNPDDPKRPVNSPKAVYQLSPEALSLVRAFGSENWKEAVAIFRKQSLALAERYAAAREMQHIPLATPDGQVVHLSPGAHSELIRQLVEVFGPHFIPGGTLIYAGDTGDKWGYASQEHFKLLGIQIDSHGKMPDVIIHDQKKNWLILCEAVTSHGPVNPKRHIELKKLFAKSSAGLVFVTAFPTRAAFCKYSGDISWETEVWCADHPTHLIHFNGERFLGPYATSSD
jgi:hypothetical protein